MTSSSLGNDWLLQDSVVSLAELSSDEPSWSVSRRDECHGYTNDVVDSKSGDVCSWARNYKYIIAYIKLIWVNLEWV